MLQDSDIILPTKVPIVKAMIFPVVMQRYESWTIKKVYEEELMLLNCGTGGLLEVPWTVKRSSQSILKEISPEIFIRRTDAEAEAPELWSPDVNSQLIGKDPDAGKG